MLRFDAPIHDETGVGAASSFGDPVAEAARTVFGIPYIYPYQRFVIANIIERKDQIVILPTGAGKSLCFQLPSSLLDGPTLIIYPLLSLISDQKRRLIEAGSEPGVLTGGQTKEERNAMFENWESGRIGTILTNPETLLSKNVREKLKSLPLSHIVIDEAHCVTEWGDTFRPSYLELGDLLSDLNGPILSAFTATASEKGVERIAGVLFKNRQFRLVRANADRPNISYGIIRCMSKDRTLVKLVGSEEKPVLVFVRSRKGAEKTARLLRERTGSDAVRFYHAGLSRDEKASVETYFFTSGDGILVSTSAYGMGVDKKNIRTVIHTCVPPSVEAYLQESGRGGRDGLRSTAILLHSIDDARHRDILERETDRIRYDAMLSYVNSGTCRREYLLSLLGQSDEACSGCDICNPVKDRESAERIRDAVLRFVRRYKRTFTAKETASILSGRKTLTLRENGCHHLKEYGKLPDWDPEDIEAAVSTMISDGLVIERPGMLPGKRSRKFLCPVESRAEIDRRRKTRAGIHALFRAFGIASDRYSAGIREQAGHKKRPSQGSTEPCDGLPEGCSIDLTEP